MTAAEVGRIDGRSILDKKTARSTSDRTHVGGGSMRGRVVIAIAVDGHGEQQPAVEPIDESNGVCESGRYVEE